MASASYCNACGAHNPHGVKSCHVCGCGLGHSPRQNPVTSASYANPKLALFDIDRTILDTKERHRSAIRAGVQPKDFNYKVFTKMSKKDKKKREDFMYREDMLAKDRVIPNSMALIEHLMKEGYTIAYCTGRAFKWFEKTKDQLEDKGFPLFQDNTGKTLLFLRRNENQSKGPYKAGVMRTLLAQYDVRFVFDDTPEVLIEGAKLGIPGVYPSIGEYWSKINPTRRNSSYLDEFPYIVDDKGHRRIDHDAEMYLPGSDTMGRTYVDQDPTMMPKKKSKGVQKTIDDYIKANPIKRGRDGKGTYMRWGKSTGKKYYYKAGNKASREKARKKAHAQAKAAFAGGYRGNPNHSEDYMVPRDIHRAVKSAMVLESRYQEGMEVPEWWKSKLSVAAKDLDALADALEYVAENPGVLKNYDLDMMMQAADESETYSRMPMPMDRRRSTTRSRVPLSNPPKSKVEKGKKLYKHMNGKDPAKVKTTTIDIGDVWYQVGEGGCWQIGYCSGKETGNSSQKYVHHFNEETKDGNLPNLYATMPESGKPMLIITGGTWKIKTDESGVAWIYD